MDELAFIRKYYSLDRIISKLKKNNPDITPREVYSELLKSQEINSESDSYGITIGQAQQLDNDHFSLGGSYWIKAIEISCGDSMVIEEGSIITFNNNKCEIYNRGIFTCDLRICE